MDRYWWDQGEFDTDLDEDEIDSDLQILDQNWRRIYYVGGIGITGKDYPTCLEKNTCDRDSCSFFFESKFEDECRLRRSKAERRRIWEIIRPWVEFERRKEARRQARKRALRSALETELRMHGRELHYSHLTNMLQERYPKLRVTEKAVLRVLCSCSDIFERVAPGVYRLLSRASTSRKD